MRIAIIFNALIGLVGNWENKEKRPINEDIKDELQWLDSYNMQYVSHAVIEEDPKTVKILALADVDVEKRKIEDGVGEDFHESIKDDMYWLDEYGMVYVSHEVVEDKNLTAEKLVKEFKRNRV